MSSLGASKLLCVQEARGATPRGCRVLVLPLCSSFIFLLAASALHSSPWRLPAAAKCLGSDSGRTFRKRWILAITKVKAGRTVPHPHPIVWMFGSFPFKTCNCYEGGMVLHYQVSDVKFVGVITGTPVCPPRMKVTWRSSQPFVERTQPADWEDWSGNMPGLWYNKNAQVEFFGPRIH